MVINLLSEEFYRQIGVKLIGSNVEASGELNNRQLQSWPPAWRTRRPQVRAGSRHDPNLSIILSIHAHL